jgi:hypothetical protein
VTQQAGQELAGMNVQLIVSDPWDFVTASGPGPYKARIVQIDSSSPPQMLLKLDKPVEYRDNRWEFLVASPRHTDDSFSFLFSGRSIHINARCIDRNDITKGDLFGVAWRGGLALIADLQKNGNEKL